MGSALRLADLLGSLSIVCDLGFGLPLQTAMRSCVIATALARDVGLGDSEVSDAYYTALLLHIGCVGMSHETAAVFGDEIRAMGAVAQTNLADPDAMAALASRLAASLDNAASSALADYLREHGDEFAHWYDTGSCEIGRHTARRLGLPDSTQQALYDVVEWWNGGGPRGVSGDDIPAAARVTHVASEAAVLAQLGDVTSVVSGLRDRVGLLDPDIVEAFAGNAEALLDGVRAEDPRHVILDVEPPPVQWHPAHDLAKVAAVFGDAVDLKTPFLHGHSSTVAMIAVAAAHDLGLDSATTRQLDIAAHLHDIGRVGVTDAIWDKPGPLTTAEWEQVRMHAYHSERILAGSPALADVSRLAGLHHERGDGSGYHRGDRGADLPTAAQVLAAADALSARTQLRPHRAPQDPADAAAEMAAEARRGLFDVDVVDAVLRAAGHERMRPRRSQRPAGLSEREVEVVRLVAAGRSNPQIAAELHISRRTAEHHVQNIYGKVGVSTRPSLALFALDNGLLDARPAHDAGK